MKRKTILVLSPDGLPIHMQPFRTAKAAAEFIAEWLKRYEIQGYYSTACGERIPLADLRGRLTTREL